MTATTVEAALAAWVRAATGLADGVVRWGEQDVSRARPMITLRIISVRQLGQDWIQTVTNPTPSAGAEVVMTARGNREAVVSIQAFAEDAVGANSARAYLERVRSAAMLPVRRAALAAAGIGIGSLSTVQSMGGPLGSSLFEPRATLEARVFLTSEASETGTIIESVAIENETTGSEFEVP